MPKKGSQHKIYLTAALLIFCTFLLLMRSAAAATAPEETFFQFAFFDRSGRRLITLGSADKEFILKAPQAVFVTNQTVLTTFSHTQKSNPGNTHRHTASNFDRLAGHVLLTETPGPANQSVLLFDQSAFSVRRLLDCTSLATDLSSDDRRRIEAAQQRSIEQSWGLLQATDGTQIHLVLFQRSGNQALASLVILQRNRILFRDFPAQFNPESTWRVDDGGNILPEQFRILYLGDVNEHLEIAYEFRGAEGNILDFFRESNGALVKIFTASRYMSPL